MHRVHSHPLLHKQVEAGEAVAARKRRAQAICLRQGRDIRRHDFGFLG